MVNKKKHQLSKLKSTSFDTLYYIDAIHDKWIDIAGREIFMHGIETDAQYDEGAEPGIEYQMATRVIKNLHILKDIDRNAPVTINMHTCGGYIEEGMAIYDTIKLMPYKVKIIVYTHARSMSSYVLQAADERIMLPNASFMFHRGSMYVGGTTQEVYSNVDWARREDSRLIDIYVDRMREKGKFKNRSASEIRKVIEDQMDKKTDVFLTASEAIEWGLADKILTSF